MQTERQSGLTLPVVLEKLLGLGLYLVGLYAALKYGSLAGVVPVFALFGILWLLPWLLFVSRFSLSEEGLKYKRWIKWHKVHWSEVRTVAGVYWFPWSLVVVKTKGRAWPLNHVWSGDSDLRRIPGAPFWQLEGKAAREIKSRMTNQKRYG